MKRFFAKISAVKHGDIDITKIVTEFVEQLKEKNIDLLVINGGFVRPKGQSSSGAILPKDWPSGLKKFFAELTRICEANGVKISTLIRGGDRGAEVGDERFEEYGLPEPIMYESQDKVATIKQIIGDTPNTFIVDRGIAPAEFTSNVHIVDGAKDSQGLLFSYIIIENLTADLKRTPSSVRRVGDVIERGGGAAAAVNPQFRAHQVQAVVPSNAIPAVGSVRPEVPAADPAQPKTTKTPTAKVTEL